MTNNVFFGNLDQCVAGKYLAGWVNVPSDQTAGNVIIRVLIDGTPVASGQADLKRGDGYRGFRISLDDASIATKLLTRRVKLVAECDSQQIDLHIYQAMLEKLLAEGIAKAPSGEKIPVQPLAPAASSSDDLSSILVPVGLKSQDGSVVVGRDGYLFLFSGSNEVAALYAKSPESPEVVATSERWHALVKARRERLAARGMAFLQVIVPEKSTVLPHLAIPELGPMTPVLQKIDGFAGGGASQSDPFSTAYHPITPALRELARQTRPAFMRTDSHLSPYGAIAVCACCLQQMKELLPAESRVIDEIGLKLDRIHPNGQVRLLSGDIAKRVLGTPIYEVAEQLDLHEFDDFGKSIKEKILKTPENGEHNGTHIVWNNPDAPIKIKIVAFANSFFERGASERGISWWFKHIFSEFHFIWSPEIDYNILDLYHPDLVVCQTIERFLMNVPKA